MSIPRSRSLAAVVGLLAAVACRQPAPPAERPAPTFNKDIAAILYEHCSTCHRPVDPAANTSDPVCFAGAPFSLLQYSDARSHARDIARATKGRAMPPWLPQQGYGEFANARRLREDQIDLIQQWVQQGAVEGEAGDRPPIPKWPDGWQLGEPDLVLKMPRAYSLPAAGKDVFRNFVIPVPSGSTRYVRAIEFRADTPSILHHASVGIDRMRLARKLDRADKEPGFAAMPDDEVQNVFGWSPGKVPFMEPADRAWPLQKGSDLVVSLHMLPNGKPLLVQPSIGLFLTDTPPMHEPLLIKLESKAIEIPAGQSDYSVEDRYVLPADIDVVSVYPHAHYLARKMQGSAALPDGTTKWLISIASWDFRWQDQYRYTSPVFLPKGTTLKMRFTYDNSDGNPHNPYRPAQPVTWGPRSSDEMGALWLEILPRDSRDVNVLMRDYQARSLLADIAGAEMHAAASPRDPLAHNFLATKYLQAGRVADAMAHLNEALRLKPDDAEAHSNLATAFHMQGHLVDAVQHAREAARLKPDDDRVHFNLGNLMAASGKPEEAERELRRAVQLNPDNGDAQFNLGVLLGSGNRLDEAIAHLRRAVDINPQNGDAHRNLGLGLGFAGKLDEAIDEVNTSLTIQPDSAEGRRTLASLENAHRAQRARRRRGGQP